MKMKTTLSILALLSLATNQSQAEGTTIGIGAAVNSDLTIYLPITTENLLIEPTLSLYSSDSESTSSSSTSNISQSSNYKTLVIGLGVFKHSKVIDKTYIYFGARFGYIETERDNSYNVTISTSSVSEGKEDGYFVAPTIGAEYFLTNNFSMGIDLSINYSKTEGSDKSTYTGTTITNDTSETKSTTYNTEAEVIVRYHF